MRHCICLRVSGLNNYVFKVGIVALLVALFAGCNDRSGLESKEVVGELFPQFELANHEGVVRSNSDFHGKIVVVNFWATWCAPCVAELPALERLYQRLKKDGLHVVAVSVDSRDAREEVENMRKRFNLSFEILFDPDISLPPKLDITGFPETFFLDRNGRMLSVFDPQEGKKTFRVISDRAWDEPPMLASIEDLLR